MTTAITPILMASAKSASNPSPHALVSAGRACNSYPLSHLPMKPPPSRKSLMPIDHVSYRIKPVYTPECIYLLVILTILYLFTTNIRSTYHRWLSSGHTIYGDLKSRLSPAFPSQEHLPVASHPVRRLSDRPASTMTSRKSSYNLAASDQFSAGLGMPRPQRLGSSFAPPDIHSRSAPVSPQNSPHLSPADELYYRSRLDDDESVIETPNISRRSSYIYMNAGSDHTPFALSQEPSSYFLPTPSNAGSMGLGLGTPNSLNHPGFASLRRTSSSNLNGNGISTSQAAPVPSRRVTIPLSRMASTSDWSAAAKAKEKTMFGLMVESLPVPQAVRREGSKKWFRTVQGFLRWLWKTRNGVVLRS